MALKSKLTEAAAMHLPETTLQLYLEPEHVSLLALKPLMANMDQAQLCSLLCLTQTQLACGLIDFDKG